MSIAMKAALFAAALTLVCAQTPEAAMAQSVQLGQTITISITPIVQSISVTPVAPCTLSGNNLTCMLFPNNAGAPLDSVSFVTNPSGSNFTGTLVLGGTNAASFAWANPVSGCTISGATVTCTNAITSGPMVSLAVGPSAITPGSYAVTNTATP